MISNFCCFERSALIHFVAAFALKRLLSVFFSLPFEYTATIDFVWCIIHLFFANVFIVHLSNMFQLQEREYYICDFVQLLTRLLLLLLLIRSSFSSEIYQALISKSIEFPNQLKCFLLLFLLSKNHMLGREKKIMLNHIFIRMIFHDLFGRNAVLPLSVQLSHAVRHSTSIETKKFNGLKCLQTNLLN